MIGVLLLATLACSLVTGGGGQPTNAVNEARDVEKTIEAMAATLQADAQRTSVAAPTELPVQDTQTPDGAAGGVGAITGRLSYPSEFIPEMQIVAFNVETGEWFYVQTVLNQPDYRIDNLPPGTYHVVAYTIPQESIPELVGGYTEFVRCGATVECTDRSLVDVVVVAGETVSDITPMDWFLPEGSYPANPLVP